MKALEIVSQPPSSAPAERALVAYMNARALTHCLVELGRAEAGTAALDQDHLVALGRLLSQANEALFDAFDDLQRAPAAKRAAADA